MLIFIIHYFKLHYFKLLLPNTEDDRDHPHETTPQLPKEDFYGFIFHPDMDTMESKAGTLMNEQCNSKKNGVSGLLRKRLWKALHLSSPVTLSQYCTGSCPNLLMNKNELLEQKTGRAASSRSQSDMKTHRVLCSTLSSDGARQFNGLVSQKSLDAQMKQACSGRAASSTGSLEQTSLFCSSESTSSSKSIMSTPLESQAKPKSFFRFSLFSPLMQSNNFELDSSSFSVSGSKKRLHNCLKSRVTNDPKPEELQNFSEPVITRIMDCIYVGNLHAAYSGQVLCRNNIDSIIDMSSLPRDCSMSFIPCTCSRGPQHSWSRLKVHIQGDSEEECTSLHLPCFWDINGCIEASLEKRKRVLIHCRDGYSLAPTCVIQYLMVKHNMRLLAAYEFVRARYPLNIRECHQDLLVGLEKSLWPGEGDTQCFKQAISRKMAWEGAN
ncbi:uncharacterized protein LOC125425758 isoform X2 [Sphaerodactylus townsendi]|uniref:uncharacterized protein LOC125425758 isoform X2 n=2 Tax=Sphaerodactylus townsendi TaxID=933632 RepID=UPI00202757DF|nr:uncharacterized protein LOC125425758 isoform X2 [Sphaerodactylus townsendi]